MGKKKNRKNGTCVSLYTEFRSYTQSNILACIYLYVNPTAFAQIFALIYSPDDLMLVVESQSLSADLENSELCRKIFGDSI